MVLVVVAHPDDESFGCGSLLADAAAHGVTTVVACATRGEAGSLRPGTSVDGLDLAEVRESELRQAAALLGVDRVEVFAWADSGMAGQPVAGSLVAAPLQEVAAEIACLIDDVHPDVVVTMDGTDGHRDHARIRGATLLATDLATWPVGRVYFQCLPQSLMTQWRDELRVHRPESDHLGVATPGTPDALITTVIDTAEHLEVREAAIAAHASQVSPYEGMSSSLRRAFLTVDRLRRVRPEWTGSSIEHQILDAPPIGRGT